MTSTPYTGVSKPLSISDFWFNLNLARRFAFLALVLSVAGTTVLGGWVSSKIEQSAMARQANSAALYMGHFVAPLLQELAFREQLPRDASCSLAKS